MEQKPTDALDVLQVPFDRPDAYGALAMPVYHTVAFEFDTAEEMEAAFCGRSAGHAYSRITNPTVQYLEKRVKVLQHALSVTALSSGMAAISCALLSVARAGANIVTSRHLFGNTLSLLTDTLGTLGVEVRLCDLTSPDEVRAHVDAQTCAIFCEIITNPQLEVADLRLLSAIGHEVGAPLMADTTAVPFTVFRAKDFGVDVEVLSSTKYVSGGGTGLGGLVIDYGSFPWRRSCSLSDKAQRFGAFAFTAKLRQEVYRNLGCYMTPQVAYMQTLGLETLQLRFERQASTALQLARALRGEPGILSVNHVGLEEHPFYALARRQFGPLASAMFTFDLPSRTAAFACLNALQHIRRATNLFENHTLAIHPASTIFGTFTAEQRRQMNVGEGTIRLSVGLEPVDVLLDDVRRAVAKAREA